MPITAARSYLPDSISEVAANVAMLPEAQAASWREAGIPKKAGSEAEKKCS
jgi:hypothetical protein